MGWNLKFSSRAPLMSSLSVQPLDTPAVMLAVTVTDRLYPFELKSKQTLPLLSCFRSGQQSQ